MEECSNNLGVPVSYIYPVKNYHEERATNATMDILILDALQHIVNFANDYVEDQVLGWFLISRLCRMCVGNVYNWITMLNVKVHAWDTV